MATLDTLEQTLRQTAMARASCLTQPLSDTQYSAGFNTLVQGSGGMIYQGFIIPQLSSLLDSLLNSRIQISVLEIGPGPKSVLGCLPHHVRRKIKRYVALEPNELLASTLEDWLHPTPEVEPPLPGLQCCPDIHRIPFTLDNTSSSSTSIGITGDEKFDVILFCHSMYGMKPTHKYIKHALEALDEHQEGGTVVVFHRDGALDLDGLVSHRTASYPAGVTRVATDDRTLDKFTRFIAGFTLQDEEMDRTLRGEWRKLCHVLGRHEAAHPDHLSFSSPEVMVTFTKHATSLPDLVAQVPVANSARRIKNQQALLQHPAAIVRPTDIEHIQQCVRWALRRDFKLIVMSGSHSGHCLKHNVVSIDMSAFNGVNVVTSESEEGNPDSGLDSLVVAEAGCNTGDIIRKTMEAGLTVPLGARPSVGAGLWLQGGVGHLARLHGLACDAVVGAVIVSVDSGRVMYVGRVPSRYRPVSAVRSEIETDLLWALKGAGTNAGIVVSVVFKTYAAPTYSVRTWRIPLKDDLEVQSKLGAFAQCARDLARDCSADAYLYSDDAQIHLGVTMLETAATKVPCQSQTHLSTVLGPEDDFKVVDGIGLFETEMYISGMHGGHGGGKTSSLKRCLFLKYIENVSIIKVLIAAIGTRPSPLCYFHLLQGGGAVSDTAHDATAFGCRDWDFACVITGVWPRDQDGTGVARDAVQWVYNVANNLLPLSSGAYGADLGSDPRDAALAAQAFGSNRRRLRQLKHRLDPRNMLAYACPLPKPPITQRLVILVTGESGVGKDYCADIWVSVFTERVHGYRKVRKASISDATKREYAAASGADLVGLLGNRAYKERHRPALTTFLHEQLRQRPRLLEEHFLSVVSDAADADVLFITGMRDEAPTATLSHLVPGRRLVDVRVTASEETRRTRRGCEVSDDIGHKINDCSGGNNDKGGISNLTTLDYRPGLVFSNDVIGHEAIKRFANQHLLPFLHEDLERLASMVHPITDFPRPGIEFRHVLNISQQRGGLSLCTSLLQTRFTGDWAKVGAMACCEAGGFIYASALAQQVAVSLALIRKAGKLPPPTVSVSKPSSHISSPTSRSSREKRIEMSQDLIPRGASVVVVDDVLATGKTLCAILQLLTQAGTKSESISVMVVVEFPLHCGRDLLYRYGFGGVSIQSLLVFDGA